MAGTIREILKERLGRFYRRGSRTHGIFKVEVTLEIIGKLLV